MICLLDINAWFLWDLLCIAINGLTSLDNQLWMIVLPHIKCSSTLLEKVYHKSKIKKEEQRKFPLFPVASTLAICSIASNPLYEIVHARYSAQSAVVAYNARVSSPARQFIVNSTSSPTAICAGAANKFAGQVAKCTPHGRARGHERFDNIAILKVNAIWFFPGEFENQGLSIAAVNSTRSVSSSVSSRR